MGSTAISLKQLFSTEERCLPFGRQALKFDCDFTLQPEYVVGPQQLNNIRPFSGIKGIYIQTENIASGNVLNYQISNTTSILSGSAFQVVQSPTTGSKYYLAQGPFRSVEYNSGISVNFAAPLAGYGYANLAGNSFGQNNQIGIMGPDGLLVVPILDSSVTTNSLGLAKVNPQTGAVVSTVTIPATDSLPNGNFSMVLKSDGTCFISYVVIGATNQSYVVGIDTNTMTILGTFTGATNTVASGNVQPAILALDSNENVVVFFSTGAFDVTMAVFPIASLSGGVYTGSFNPTVSEQSLYFNNGLGMIANQNGGVDFFIRVNTGCWVYRLDGPSFSFPSTPANTGIAGSVPSIIENYPVIPFSNYPEKGYQYFYTWNYQPDLDGVIRNFTLVQWDAYTLQVVNTFLCPFSSQYLLNPGNMYSALLSFDVDTGDFYMVNGQVSDNIEYAIIGSSILYIVVNGTGQKIAIQLAPEMSVWIPLFALENDNVTLSSTSNKITAMLTNFDVMPFILSQVQTIPAGQGISVNGVAV